MLFLVGNSTNNIKLCFPIYILQEFKLLTFPWILLVIIELILYLLTLFFAVKCAFIIMKVRAFHKNLSSLALVLILQYAEPLIAKVISWPYETGFWTLKGKLMLYFLYGNCLQVHLIFHSQIQQ